MKKLSTLRSKEIARIIKGGRLYRSRSLLVFVEPLQRGDLTNSFTAGDSSDFCKLSKGRVAFIAPKRLGTAVLRNRCKRLLRVGFRYATSSTVAKVVCSHNIILMATARTADKKFSEIGAELEKMLSLVIQDQKEARAKDC